MKKDLLQSNQCAERLKALSEPLRLRIVDHLRAGPLSVGELAEKLGVEVVTVSHHLGILKHAELVRNERRGRFIVYRLHEEVFQPEDGRQTKDHIDLGCCRLEIPK